jgi:hypothetical protein
VNGKKHFFLGTVASLAHLKNGLKVVMRKYFERF